MQQAAAFSNESPTQWVSFALVSKHFLTRANTENDFSFSVFAFGMLTGLDLFDVVFVA